MPWFKVDDGLAMHPKAIAAGNSAMGLWLRAGSWCASQLTDGRLPGAMLAPLGGRARDAARLVEVGLWSQVDGGYQFKDWQHYQPTKSQVEADREQTRKRVSKWREEHRNGVTNGVRNGVTERVTNGGVTGAPTRPDPTSSGEGSQSALGSSHDRTSDGPDLAKIATRLGADEGWARRVADQVLTRAPTDVRDPTAYVLRAIDERPNDYRPTATAPKTEDQCWHGRDAATCPWPGEHEVAG